MNDDQFERASAYLDGELSPDDRATVEADPALMALVDQMAGLQTKMAAVAPPQLDREQRILAAMAAANVAPTTSTSVSADNEGPALQRATPPPIHAVQPDPTSAPVTHLPTPDQPAFQPPASTPTGQGVVHELSSARNASARNGFGHKRSTRWLGAVAGVLTIGVLGAAFVGIVGSRDGTVGDSAGEAADPAADAAANVTVPDRANGDNDEALETEDAAPTTIPEAMATQDVSAAEGSGGSQADTSEVQAVQTTAGASSANDDASPPLGGTAMIVEIWGNPPQIVGSDDLAAFTDDAMSLVPTGLWPFVALDCIPRDPQGQQLVPLTQVSFQTDETAEPIEAVVAVSLNRTTSPPEFRSFVVDPDDCSILDSAEGTL